MKKHARKYDLDHWRKILGNYSRVSDCERDHGLPAKSLVDTFRRKGDHAAAHLAKVAVPHGQEIKSITLQRDAKGKTKGETLRTQQEAKDPPQFRPLPPDHALKGVTTWLGPRGDVRQQVVMARQDEAARWEKFWAACEKATERYRGIAAVEAAPVPSTQDHDTLTMYNLGDPHIGMLAWGKETGVDFDVRIAERELFGVVDMLVERAPASSEAVIADVGDFVHAQNDKQLTPNGSNKLDVDGRMAKVNEIAFMLMRRLVDRVRQKHARTRVVAIPGNHDPDTARMLTLWLRAVYENVSSVEVLANWSPFTYLEWGSNLFGWAHGDGAKMDQLPSIMANDQAQAWGRTTHRYWHTGHVHHRNVLEHGGCVVESHRTVAPNDAWHNWKGYRSGKSLSAITYAREGGEISRQTVDLSVARSRIAASIRSDTQDVRTGKPNDRPAKRT